MILGVKIFEVFKVGICEVENAPQSIHCELLLCALRQVAVSKRVREKEGLVKRFRDMSHHAEDQPLLQLPLLGLTNTKCAARWRRLRADVCYL